MYVCGFNGFNQIGSLVKLLYKDEDGNQLLNHLPNLNSLKEFVAVSNGPVESVGSIFVFSWSYCILCSGNSMWICGFTSKTKDSIQKVTSPNSLNFHQISCNQNQLICVLEGGGCWLYSLEQEQWKDLTQILTTEQYEESDIPACIEKVCCGETVTVALTKTGEVYNIPNKISVPGTKIMDVACGRSHILMLSESGDVYTVGEGSRGQLGHGELENEEYPRLVEGLAGLKVAAVAAGGWHSCALTADGDLYSWGWNMAGQLGITGKDSTNKVSVQALPHIVDWPSGEDVHVSKVACGARHTLAVLDDGSLWGCGWNAYGQLAMSDLKSTERMTKLPVPSDRIKDIICGPWNSCLIT